MKKSIVLAGGCFWGVQEYFRRIDGVINTKVGYAQGQLKNPTYKEVKAQISGHTEVCWIEYEDSILSLENLLEYFFDVIDPTSLNKQGEDEGTSYRTGIFPSNEDDLCRSKAFLVEKQRNFDKRIVVECELLDVFYDAEEYHQDYLIKNPTGYCHIDFSKLNKERK